jgi:AcrR family transcriptional regulator
MTQRRSSTAPTGAASGGAAGGASGLRARRRDETRRRIATAAVELVSEQGIPATTIEQIVARAEVGRATFFRYFESKELAVAVGLNDVAVYVFTSALQSQPDELGPLDAVRATHRELAAGFDGMRAMYLEQAQLSRSSPAMVAWTLYLYVDWEIAIAEAVRPRLSNPVEHDPRPRMVGALAMAAARLACDEWVATGGRGDLPEMLQQYLAAFEVGASASLE